MFDFYKEKFDENYRKIFFSINKQGNIKHYYNKKVTEICTLCDRHCPIKSLQEFIKYCILNKKCCINLFFNKLLDKNHTQDLICEKCNSNYSFEKRCLLLLISIYFSYLQKNL